jgi:hypothetical protein
MVALNMCVIPGTIMASAHEFTDMYIICFYNGIEVFSFRNMKMGSVREENNRHYYIYRVPERK